MLRRVITLVGIAAILTGLGFLGAAIATPAAYVRAGLSVSMETYSEATYDAVIAIACFVFAACCILAVAQPGARPAAKPHAEDTHQIWPPREG